MNSPGDNEETPPWKHVVASWIESASRQKLEESFDKEFYLVKDAPNELAKRGLEVSLEQFRRWIRAKEVKVQQPSPRKTVIHRSELARLLMGSRW
jgi:NOL1/NOP2/fmu family ribosome biogenesis protein